MTIDSYEDVPVYDEKALQKAVANQPISVAVEAGGMDFQLYVSVRSSILSTAFNLFFYGINCMCKLGFAKSNTS